MMADLAEWFRMVVEQLILLIGYPGITVTLLAELVFPPTPSEAVMLFSGFLIGEGQLHFQGVLIASTVGVLIGGLVVYAIGRHIDAAIIRAGFARYGRYVLVNVNDYDRARHLFQRYGMWVVLLSRALPMVRSFVPLLAGMERMPLPRFILFFTAGTIFYNALYIGLGIFVGDNWETVLHYLDRYNDIGWVLTVVGVVVLIYLRVIRPYLHRRSAHP